MTEELIREARAFAALGSDLNAVEANRLIFELCDALEAATRETESVEYGITFDDEYRPAVEPQNYSGSETLAGAIETAKRLAGGSSDWKVWSRPLKPKVIAVAAGPWEPVGGESE